MICTGPEVNQHLPKAVSDTPKALPTLPSPASLTFPVSPGHSASLPTERNQAAFGEWCQLVASTKNCFSPLLLSPFSWRNLYCSPPHPFPSVSTNFDHRKLNFKVRSPGIESRFPTSLQGDLGKVTGPLFASLPLCKHEQKYLPTQQGIYEAPNRYYHSEQNCIHLTEGTAVTLC